MSFRIFAAGVPKFNYIKDKLPDGEVFEAVKVIHAFTDCSVAFCARSWASDR